MLADGRRPEAEQVLALLKKAPGTENYEAEVYEAMGWHVFLGEVEKASAILHDLLSRELPLQVRKEYFLLYVPVRVLLGDRDSWKKELGRLAGEDGGAWIDQLLRMMAGEVSRDELRIKAINKQRLLSYYAVTGVLAEMEGRVEEAQDAYRRAIESVHVEQYDWIIAYDGVRRFDMASSKITGVMFSPLKVVGLHPGIRTPEKAPVPTPAPGPQPTPSPKPAPTPAPGMTP